MLANEGKFVGFWAPRIGDEAARTEMEGDKVAARRLPAQLRLDTVCYCGHQGEYPRADGGRRGGLLASRPPAWCSPPTGFVR